MSTTVLTHTEMVKKFINAMPEEWHQEGGFMSISGQGSNELLATYPTIGPDDLPCSVADAEPTYKRFCEDLNRAAAAGHFKLTMTGINDYGMMALISFTGPLV